MTELTSRKELNWCFPDFITGNNFETMVSHETEITHLKAEVESIKQEYGQRINLANKMIHELKNSINVVNEDLVEVIQDIIHKITYHLIQKELAKEPELIQKSLEHFINLIPYKNGMITVYLSQADIDKIKELDNQFIIAKADPAFKSGDILVKSNLGEIRALLSERINMLLKDDHA